MCKPSLFFGLVVIKSFSFLVGDYFHKYFFQYNVGTFWAHCNSRPWGTKLNAYRRQLFFFHLVTRMAFLFSSVAAYETFVFFSSVLPQEVRLILTHFFSIKPLFMQSFIAVLVLVSFFIAVFITLTLKLLMSWTFIVLKFVSSIWIFYIQIWRLC